MTAKELLLTPESRLLPGAEEWAEYIADYSRHDSTDLASLNYCWDGAIPERSRWAAELEELDNHFDSLRLPGKDD